MAVKPQGNNILAGTSLAIAQIQSPDFVSGSTGWIIRQDGSAEFNNVNIRGSLTSGGVFVYTGPPGFGNTPIGWISDQSTDPYGNTLPNGATMGINFSGTFSAGNTLTSTLGTAAYSTTPSANTLVWTGAPSLFRDASSNLIQPGLIGYSKVGAVYFATQIGGTGSSEGLAFYTATTQAGPWTLRGFLLANASGMQMVSEGPLSLTTQGSAGAVISNLSSGLSGGVPVTSIDRTQLSVGNSTTLTDLTTAWTIPAGDGSNGAKYTIETFITITTGATAAETFTLGIDLNSGTTTVALATLGAAFNGSALSTTYDIPVRLTVVPGAGASGSDAQITLSGPLGDTSANRTSVNSANMSGHSNVTAFNAAVSNTIALYAQWGGTGGVGQSASANWSEFTRSGQN